MALELRQQLKLSQQLVMTPQLQQAIKLLQLSRLELLDAVQQELLENPLLEEAQPDVEDVIGTDREEKAPAESETTAASDADVLTQTTDWEDYLGDFSSSGKESRTYEAEIPEDGMSFEARLSSAPSLEGHLQWQMRLSGFSDMDLIIAEQVLGNVSDAGYLQSTAEEIAAASQSTVEQVEDFLARLRMLDPVGVGSRTVQECLLAQVHAHGMQHDTILVELIANHLDDFEKRRYKPLARKFKISMEELREYLDVIQSFNPYPGSDYSGGEARYVSPDAYVYKFDDEFVIMLNEEGLPKLQLNSIFEQASTQKGAAKEYFTEKMRSAAWLIKSLHQRQRTLYKVVESIVRFQRDFFEEGVTHLRPLILKDVADDIGMHESTVSRITTSKYVATPHGIFELKFFFNSALGMGDGSQVGSESVKAMIKDLVGGENPKKPLSDERIAEILKEKLDVNIARRTVAKYRTALGIQSSSKRKNVF